MPIDPAHASTINSLLAARMIQDSIRKADPRPDIAEVKAAVAELANELIRQAEIQEPDNVPQLVADIEDLLRTIAEMLAEESTREWDFHVIRDPQTNLIAEIHAR